MPSGLFWRKKEICLNDCIQWQVDYFEEKEIGWNNCIQCQVGYFEEKEICLNDCIQWQVDYFEEKEIGWNNCIHGNWVILKNGNLPKWLYSMASGLFGEKEICLNDCIQWQVGYFEEKEIGLK